MSNIRPTKRDKIILSLILLVFCLAVGAYFSDSDLVLNAFYVALVFSGAWMLISTAIDIGYSLLSYRWKKTSYKVIDRDFTVSVGNREISTKFEPKFIVEYRYKDNIYTRSSEDGLNIWLGKVFYTQSKVQRHLEDVSNYLYGEVLYVNPNNPRIAFVRAGIGRNQVGMAMFSLFLIILPIMTYLELIEWR
ncbi:DUF3592 domain-containing protein [Pseudomonadota bacterium]